MSLQKSYPSLLTADLAAAEGWGAVFLYVDDLAAERRRLDGLPSDPSRPHDRADEARLSIRGAVAE